MRALLKRHRRLLILLAAPLCYELLLRSLDALGLMQTLLTRPANPTTWIALPLMVTLLSLRLFTLFVLPGWLLVLAIRWLASRKVSHEGTGYSPGP